jgi:BirA family biotin operon repressor/biotin-[acetyl-CoA-carboxylase] ligase
MPQALTLRAGLALALAIEEFAPALRAELKWPNDIMLGGKKAAGILTEADEKTVYIGVGINVSQREFPPGLQSKATSIALALGGTPERNAVPLEGAGQDLALHAMDAGLTAPYSRFTLLVKILHAMRRELEAARPWRARLETRLYMNGKTVRFAPGGPDSALVIEGLLQGLGPGGEILIAAADGSEVKSFSSGELRIYG